MKTQVNIVFVVLLALLLQIFSATNAEAQEIELVFDAETLLAPKLANVDFVSDGSNLYYVAFNADGVAEVIRSDGSEAGTAPLLALPGIENFSGSLSLIGNFLFFAAFSEEFGREPYVVNLATQSFEMLGDLDPGAASSGPSRFYEVNGNIVFSAIDENFGRELWTTDGTPGGTSRLTDLSMGPPFGARTIFGLLGDSLIFAGSTVSRGIELWKTDGTLVGTELIRDINPLALNSNPTSFTKISETTALFTASTSSEGRELWRTNGTFAGTALVRDINPSPGSSNINSLRGGDGMAYFTASDGTSGRELWRSDGTLGGTELVEDFTPGSDSTDFERLLGVTNADLLFSLRSEDEGIELYRTTGNGTAMSLFRDINPGIESSNPLGGISFNGEVYFYAYEPMTGYELYRSDASTLSVIDVLPGPLSSGPVFFFLESFFEIAGVPYFMATSDEFALFELTGDGTGATKRVSFSTSNGETFGTGLSIYGSQDGSTGYCASGEIQSTGRSLWCTDEVSQVPMQQATNFEIREVFTPSFLGGDRLVSGDVSIQGEGLYGEELYRVNSDGPTLVKDIAPGMSFSSSISSRPNSFVELDGKVFFIASDANFDPELWSTDGTEGGTQRFFDFRPAGDDRVDDLLLYKDKLFFSAYDVATNATQLWSSDGTVAGTQVVRTIQSNPPGGRFDEFSIQNDILYFSAEDPLDGEELFQSDGTFDGTFKVQDINIGPDDSDPRILGSTEDIVFLNATGAGIGRELFKLEGGVVSLVLDIDSGPDSSFPSNAVVFENEIYFNASEPVTGGELWKSDGTTDGTVIVKDIVPGPDGSFPSGLRVMGDLLYFIARSENGEEELFRSDGSEDGTYPVDPDLNQTSTSPIPQPSPAPPNTRISVVGENNLIVSLVSTQYGSEVFKVRDECIGQIDVFIEGPCGCDVQEVDANSNGAFECQPVEETKALIDSLRTALRQLRKPPSFEPGQTKKRRKKVRAKRKAARLKAKELRALLVEFNAYYASNKDLVPFTGAEKSFNRLLKKLRTNSKKAARFRASFSKEKKMGVRNANQLLKRI